TTYIYIGCSDCRQIRKRAYNFFEKVELITEIRSLSADCLPSLLDASVCGVSASQLFGWSVANFSHPLRVSVHIKQ
ncbi:hypothetical protein M4D76_26105, partial [Peribacillus frigoritolerans]|uniref:hypothetical protein n=2 Tax=Bacillaceae TaxID=186817 RepID=UPI0021A95FEA